jgi:hypothetical protein
MAGVQPRAVLARSRGVARPRGCEAAWSRGTWPRVCEAGRPRGCSVARQATRPRGCDHDAALAGGREISETLSLLQLCSHDQMSFYLSSVSCFGVLVMECA